MNVYFCTEDNSLVEEPVAALDYARNNDKFLSKFKSLTEHQIFSCPALRDYYKNTFVVTSPYDYNFNVTDSGVTSSDYNQEFFNVAIVPRIDKLRFVTYTHPRMMFFAEKPLVAQQLPPIMTSKNIPNATYIAGQFDIGKHFRRVELAFALTEDQTIQINRGDALYNMKFLTDEKITFKRFFMTPEMLDLSYKTMMLRNRTYKMRPLQFFYDLTERTGLRKRFLKLIRENLAD